MNHLNVKINSIGREAVLKHLAGKGVTPGPDDILKGPDGRDYHLIISTKRYNVKDGSKCTGLNAVRLAKIEAKVKALKVAGAYLVFVDAKLGSVYGGYLHKLREAKEFDGVRWPLTAPSPGGLITYFSVFSMQTLFTLDPLTVKQLNDLGSDNKYPKNQTKLF